MPAVSKPSYRARSWESHGATKSAWEVSFFVIDGQKRRRVLRSGFATRRAAEAAFRDYSKEVMEGDFDKKPAVVAPTLKEFMERYLVEGTAGKRATSIENDRLAFAHFLKHVPGQLRIDEVRPEHIDAFVAKRLKERPLRGSKRAICSEATVRRELTSIRLLFNVAIRWRLIATNPTEGNGEALPSGGGRGVLGGQRTGRAAAGVRRNRRKDEQRKGNLLQTQFWAGHSLSASPCGGRALHRASSIRDFSPVVERRGLPAQSPHSSKLSGVHDEDEANPHVGDSPCPSA
jgi:hypothetical protein